jgi:ribose transport system substrate-binding protein
VSKKMLALLAVLAMAIAGAGCGSSSSSGGSSGGGSGSSSGYKIAYSNSELGNTFHQVLISNAKSTAAQAEKAGLLTQFTVSDANGSPQTQAQQIRTFVVQHYNAIIVDASSATALNSAIQQACQAGVLVIAVNENVTAPCAYNVNEHYPAETAAQVRAIATTLKGQGSVLDDRGIAGTTSDQLLESGAASALKKAPGLKVVGTVYGQWATTITEQQISQVLPSLGSVQAVVSQGAGEVGVVRAFQSAHKPVPLVYFGNAGQDLRVWASLVKQNPNYHVFSISSFPSISGFGIYTAVALLQHKIHLAQKTIWVPLFEIPAKSLQQWIKVTPLDSQASLPFTYPDTLAILKKEPNVPAILAPSPTSNVAQMVAQRG